MTSRTRVWTYTGWSVIRGTDEIGEILRLQVRRESRTTKLHQSHRFREMCANREHVHLIIDVTNSNMDA